MAWNRSGRAVEAAEMADTRVMVHIDKGVALPSILELLRPGRRRDPLLPGKGRSYHWRRRPGASRRCTKRRKRGVFFDLGHGAGSFHYGIAKRAVELGFLSDVISTDLHVYSLKSPVYSLPETASKLLNMGLGFRRDRPPDDSPNPAQRPEPVRGHRDAQDREASPISPFSVWKRAAIYVCRRPRPAGNRTDA